MFLMVLLSDLLIGSNLSLSNMSLDGKLTVAMPPGPSLCASGVDSTSGGAAKVGLKAAGGGAANVGLKAGGGSADGSSLRPGHLVAPGESTDCSGSSAGCCCGGRSCWCRVVASFRRLSKRPVNLF
jgi:hypothetical protein